MGKLLIVNGSPRAPKSNSKRYAALVRQNWPEEADEYPAISRRHTDICSRMGDYSDLLLVFPLYADAPPAVLLSFLQALEKQAPPEKPAIHVLINCGFLEPEQNAAAVDILRYYCQKNGFPYGMTLCIGSGEAILDTPFAFLARRKIRRFARGIRAGRKEALSVAMPLSKRLFLRASARYWIGYGARYGITEEQMRTMEIEGQ